MQVFTNATPLISLAKVQRLNFLEHFFTEILIPGSVYNEITQNMKFAYEADLIRSCSFLRQTSVINHTMVVSLRAAGLDLGESEAISLAASHNNSLLLMDERRGRQIALNLGLKTTGTLGIIVRAKQDGLNDKAKPCLNQLRREGVYISDRFYLEILTAVDER